MSQKPNTKRLYFFAIVFIVIALLIVFLSQKITSSQELSYDRSENIDFEAKSLTPLYDDTNTSPVSTDDMMMESSNSTQPSLTVTNTDTGTVATVPPEDLTAQVTDKKVVKTGEISIHVNSIEKSIDQIKTIALAHGGDEVSSDFAKNSFNKTGFIVIKIPVDHYTDTFNQIKAIAPLVTHESSQAQDVTAQFIDLESRIKNKKEHEERLRTFFDKAEDVDELIQVERELARVRTEIEQMESQLKYLQDQTQFSTIHTTLLEDANIVISDEWRPFQVIKDSFNTLISKSTNLINLGLRFIIIALPFIILFGLTAWFLYWTAKHIFKK